MFVSRLVCYLYCFLLTTHLYAWYDEGHAIIAEIAYANLSNTAKNRVDASIETLQKEYPEIHTFSDLVLWPSQIRDQGLTVYEHWHHLQQSDSNKMEDDNIVWALGELTPLLNHRSVKEFEKARFLALYAHLFGDVHQPLLTLNADQKHPVDQTLMAMWENGFGLLDKDVSMKGVHEVAMRLTETYPPQPNVKSKNNVSTYLEENQKLAENFVFTYDNNKPISPEYIKKGKQIVEERLALAGYRLAQKLNKHLA